VPLGHLRSFLTLLVVLHHAALAYLPYAPSPPASLTDNLIWAAFPVTDTDRSPGLDLLVGFNDVFFMSLMFLVSGIFAWPSLTRRGAGAFAYERVLRLGAPFVVSAAVLAPLAYYPSYLISGAAGSSSFVSQWLALPSWPAGPAWFLWVLLAYGLIAAGAYALTPSWGVTLGRISGRLSRRPIVYALALLAVSAAAYLPMAAAFTPEYWFSAGPFFVQSSRALHYAVYFIAGLGLGAFGIGQGLLDPVGRLARRWWMWCGLALLAYIAAIAMFLIILSTLKTGGPSAGLKAAGNFTFVLSCLCSSMAFLGTFLRFAKRSGPVGTSLGANAYGIYLFHYFCVSWLQYALLGFALHGAVKALLVTTGAVTISWGLTAALRRAPAVTRVI
jgi:peptidoglycan/LPS O-acetylase OafA/YrhL